MLRPRLGVVYVVCLLVTFGKVASTGSWSGDIRRFVIRPLDGSLLPLRRSQASNPLVERFSTSRCQRPHLALRCTPISLARTVPRSDSVFSVAPEIYGIVSEGRTERMRRNIGSGCPTQSCWLRVESSGRINAELRRGAGCGACAERFESARGSRWIGTLQDADAHFKATAIKRKIKIKRGKSTYAKEA